MDIYYLWVIVGLGGTENLSVGIELIPTDNFYLWVILLPTAFLPTIELQINIYWQNPLPPDKWLFPTLKPLLAKLTFLVVNTLFIVVDFRLRIKVDVDLKLKQTT